MRANNSAESIKLLHILADDQLQTGPAAMLRLVMWSSPVLRALIAMKKYVANDRNVDADT